MRERAIRAVLLAALVAAAAGRAPAQGRGAREPRPAATWDVFSNADPPRRWLTTPATTSVATSTPAITSAAVTGPIRSTLRRNAATPLSSHARNAHARFIVRGR
jgi:hypothetical protein